MKREEGGGGGDRQTSLSLSLSLVALSIGQQTVDNLQLPLWGNLIEVGGPDQLYMKEMRGEGRGGSFYNGSSHMKFLDVRAPDQVSYL